MLIHQVLGSSTWRQTLAVDLASSHMLVHMSDALDLDAIEANLSDVEVALERLESGTYFTDEISGSALSEDVLSANPTARHA